MSTYKSSPIVTNSDPVIVSLSEFKGKERFDMRHFYTNKANELAPTTKGVNVVIEDAPTVISAIFEVISGATKAEPRTSGYMPIIVRRNEYKGHTMIDVRHFWLPKGKSKLVPSDKGVSIPVEQVEMFISVLQEVRTTIQPTIRSKPIYFDSEATVNSDIQWKNRFAQQECEQEERAFFSDPDFVAFTGNRFTHLEI
jgi:hypothetical protein